MDVISFLRGGWHCYEVTRDGAPVLSARWRKRGDHAELHHEMQQATPEAVHEAQRLFERIQNECRDAGCATIATAAEYDPVRLRYWKLMGFRTFGAVKEL